MTSIKQRIRVGTGAGFSDDRFEPAIDLAERGQVDYLAFECLAERTIARETLTRLKDPERGYTPYLVERFQAVLPACRKNNVRIVTNMGAANPLGAARVVRREAKALGLGDVPVARRATAARLQQHFAKPDADPRNSARDEPVDRTHPFAAGAPAPHPCPR